MGITLSLCLLGGSDGEGGLEKAADARRDDASADWAGLVRV